MRQHRLLRLLHLLARILQCLREVEMTLLKLDSLVQVACFSFFFFFFLFGCPTYFVAFEQLITRCLACFRAFEQFTTLIYIYIYICVCVCVCVCVLISLVFMLLVSTFYLLFIFP